MRKEAAASPPRPAPAIRILYCVTSSVPRSGRAAAAARFPVLARGSSGSSATSSSRFVRASVAVPRPVPRSRHASRAFAPRARKTGTSFYMCAFAAGSWDLNLKKEARMRKALLALPIIAAAGLAAPAMAHDGYWSGPHGYPPAAGAVAGAAAGTTVALGAYNGWWAGAALPATTAGSIAVGGVAGVGALATVDAVFNPCAGFLALFDESHGQCVVGRTGLVSVACCARAGEMAVAPPVV